MVHVADTHGPALPPPASSAPSQTPLHSHSALSLSRCPALFRVLGGGDGRCHQVLSHRQTRVSRGPGSPGSLSSGAGHRCHGRVGRVTVWGLPIFQASPRAGELELGTSCSRGAALLHSSHPETGGHLPLRLPVPVQEGGGTTRARAALPRQPRAGASFLGGCSLPSCAGVFPTRVYGSAITCAGNLATAPCFELLVVSAQF